jgi:hypothetical protein
VHDVTGDIEAFCGSSRVTIDTSGASDTASPSRARSARLFSAFRAGEPAS